MPITADRDACDVPVELEGPARIWHQEGSKLLLAAQICAAALCVILAVVFYHYAFDFLTTLSALIGVFFLYLAVGRNRHIHWHHHH